MSRLPMVAFLRQTHGNSKACMLCEPLWAVPHALVTPFASLFMYENGCSDEQIGLILSLSMAAQVLCCLFGGVITDKWGRRLTAFLSEVASWSIPCLIWFFARDFVWFLIASLLNAIWQVSILSWTALLVEDCPPGGLVYVYSWIEISGKLAAFLAPISYFFMETYAYDQVVRGLYLFAFLMMTAKAILLYHFSRETKQGLIRKNETKALPMRAMLRGYGPVLRRIIHARAMLTAFFLMLSYNITNTVMSNFLPLYITQNGQISENMISVFSCLQALVILLVMLTIQGRLARLPYRPVLLTGFLLFVLSHIWLLCMPSGHMAVWICFYLLYALSLALISPRKSALVAEFTDPQQRARVTAVLSMAMIALTSPISYLTRLLSSLDRTLPFWLDIAVAFFTCVVLVTSREMKKLDQGHS